MDAERRQLCKLSRQFHDEEPRAAEIDDMKQRLISMGMVVRKGTAVA
jgi:hypothetical protein